MNLLKPKIYKFIFKRCRVKYWYFLTQYFGSDPDPGSLNVHVDPDPDSRPLMFYSDPDPKGIKIKEDNLNKQIFN